MLPLMEATRPPLVPQWPVWAMYTGALLIVPRTGGLEWESDRSSVCWSSMFLGDDLLPWLTLALGGALVAGNLAALLRPRDAAREGELERAPVARTVLQIVIGAIAAIWALASLAG
jgi:hypothetical protein